MGAVAKLDLWKEKFRGSFVQSSIQNSSIELYALFLRIDLLQWCPLWARPRGLLDERRRKEVALRRGAGMRRQAGRQIGGVKANKTSMKVPGHLEERGRGGRPGS